MAYSEKATGPNQETLNAYNMIETFSGVTIYGNWDDWYLPKDEERVEEDDEEKQKDDEFDDTPIYYHE